MSARRRAWFFSILVMIGIVVAWIYFRPWFDFDNFKAELFGWQIQAEFNPTTWAAGFFLIYFLAASFNFPGTVFLTLAGAALFGFWRGLILVSCASSLGANVSFLAARYFWGGWLRAQRPALFARMDRAFEREGWMYLFALRMTPMFPFFLTNLGMGLTSIPLRTFHVVTQLGMLPVTVLYLWTGEQLTKVNSPNELLDFRWVLLLTGMGLVPWISRRVFRKVLEEE